MAAPFDDIQLKILPAGTLGLLWSDVDRAVILINGKDIWEIVREEQEKNGRAEKFNYHQMRLCELYDYLVEAEQSNGKEETAILCCTCDEVGCGAVVTDIIKTPDKVIWQNIRDRDKADGFSITFVFQAQVYKNFMRQLQKAATGEKQKG